MAAGLPKDVRRIAIVVIIGALMSILDTTIVNVALQTLRADLRVSLTTIQWVSTAYLLAFATVIPLTGWMAERFGPRRLWMSTVGAFMVTSGLCGAAWSADSLIAFRVLQGLAGGMIMPLGMIMLAQAAGPKNMGRVMSVVGVPMVLGPVCGPVLGGLLVDNFSWRSIFYVNLPLGALGLLLAYRLLPRGRAAGRASEAGYSTPPLDRIGLVMLPVGVAGVVLGFTEIGQHGTIADPMAWVPLLAGVLLVAAFVVRALRIEYPLVEVRLFRSPGFSAASLTVFFCGSALFGSMILLPLYYQVVRGESALTAGLLLGPQGIGTAIGMNIGGRLTDRLGAGRVVPVGLLVLVAGTLPFVFIGGHTSYVLLVAALVVRGLGIGASMMPAMAGAYATLENSAQVPRATPLLNVLQRIGGSLGVAILTVVLQGRIASTVGHGRGLGETVPAVARERLADPLAAAFAHAYTWSLIGILIALVPALVLMREERKVRTRMAAEPGADASVLAAPAGIAA